MRTKKSASDPWAYGQACKRSPGSWKLKKSGGSFPSRLGKMIGNPHCVVTGQHENTAWTARAGRSVAQRARALALKGQVKMSTIERGQHRNEWLLCARLCACPEISPESNSAQDTVKILWMRLYAEDPHEHHIRAKKDHIMWICAQ